MEIFDLTRHPDQISPAYAFDLTFVAVGMAMTGAVLYRSYRGQRPVLFYLLPALGWLIAAGLMTFHDIRHTLGVRAQVQRGEFASVEGCLNQFHPGLANPSEADSGLEQWSVAGELFWYGADEIRLGYHRVEPDGGLVHADSWVRAGYIRDDVRGHNDIVRLDVKQRACPSAPDYAKRTSS